MGGRKQEAGNRKPLCCKLFKIGNRRQKTVSAPQTFLILITVSIIVCGAFSLKIIICKKFIK